jgi:phosphoribosylanthranilate isomerase
MVVHGLRWPYYASMRTRVKICGITSVQDGLAAARAGADAIGLVLYPSSPRAVDVATAKAICAQLPPFVTKVALFVNADADSISELCQSVAIDLLQFHGNECPDYCASHGLPYIKAVRMQDGVDLHRERARYSAAQALLVDSYRAGVPGGTGETFDWARIPADLAQEIILAGGLTPTNVAAAMQQVRPWAVDVSGGVEASPGIKDNEALHTFFHAVREADYVS